MSGKTMLSGVGGALFKSVSKFVDEKSDTSMFNIVKQNKELFYSSKYYKFQWEELLIQHNNLLAEMKLMERLLSERREMRMEKEENIHVTYENVFEEMRNEIGNLKKTAQTQREEMATLKENEKELNKRIEEKEMIIEKVPSEKLLALSRVQNDELAQKLKLNETKLQQAQEDLNEAKNNIEVLIGKAGDLKTENEKMSSELKNKDVLEEKAMTIQKEVDVLRKEIAEERLNCEFKIKNVKLEKDKEMEDLKYDIKVKQKVIEEQVKELKNLKYRLKDKSNMTKFLYEKVKQVDEIILQRNEWKIKNQMFEIRYNNLHQDYIELKKEKTVLEKKIKNHKMRHLKLVDSDKIKEIELELEYMRKEKEKMKMKMKKYQSLKSKYKKLKEDHVEMSSAMAKFKKKLKKKEEENNKNSERALKKIRDDLCQEKAKNSALKEELLKIKKMKR
ncbi:tropomyosin-like [Hydractinia symbiolongicarpus]|uniref:tropomyosin-like n=1 Tax=Hydractinia symbiolongicarpus TaxID=13093 RepID=UPI002550811F|nr:tropomyosin-like [Hydractinia symbiolongicarpus]